MKTLYTYLSLALMLLCSTTVMAQSNQYLHFDRVDDHVLMQNGSSYIAGADAFSIAGWFWTDELAYGQGMIGLRGANSGFYLIQLSDGIIECRLLNSGGTLYEYVAPAFSVVPQTWQHYAWVYTGSRIELYLDGQLVGSANASGTINETDIPFAIGRSILANLDFYFGGRADEVSMWSKALTSEDIEDMMSNELSGEEAGLEAYFKCNQGVPGEDNTSIAALDNEIGDGERDGDLIGFALTGENSNFGGEFDASFQAISFPQIPNQLVDAEAFDISAESSSTLPVTFTIESGPATIEGNTITLSGETGTVVVIASQAGNGIFDPAQDIEVSFEVLDPQTNVPAIDARAPYDNVEYFVPDVGPIRLVAQSSIDFPELFGVQRLEFEIDGEVIEAEEWGGGKFSAWWNSPGLGDQTLIIRSYNNYGAAATREVDFSVSIFAGAQEIQAIDGIWMTTSTPEIEVEADLPCQFGAYDQILATLDFACPPTGGCGEWDRIANVQAQNYNGDWINIIRYITPYGTACSHTIDLTDFASVLNGKTKFRVEYPTFDNGYEVSLSLDYRAGSPEYAYSEVRPLWQDIYPFGDLANLQPVETLTKQIPEGTQSAKLKLLATGHGWGENNSGNAAEFHADTHHVWVNGEQTFEHYNYNNCNPNPDQCSPQAGNWTSPRAGWCPGAITQFEEYDLSAYTSDPTIELRYVFNEDYIDYCHPSNPDCISPDTCPNCDDGFNPQLHVASMLISYGTDPVQLPTDLRPALELDLSIYPNPANDQLTIDLRQDLAQAQISISNTMGQTVQQLSQSSFTAGQINLDIRQHPAGMYILMIQTDQGMLNKSFVIK